MRPGRPTAQYLDRVMVRLTLPGALYLGIIAMLPTIFIRYAGFSQATARGARRHVGADRRRRRARHHAPDGVAGDDAALRGLPEVAAAPWLATCSSSARPARGRAPRRRGSRTSSGCRTSRPATCCARTCATAPSSALRAKGYMDARRAGAGRARDRDARSTRIAQADAAGGFLLDGFPRNVAQAEALDAELAAARPRDRRRCSCSTCRRRRSSSASPAGWSCANGHTYHETFNPPADGAGVCDDCGAPLTAPRRRRARRRAQPLPQRVPGADRARCAATTRAPARPRSRSTARGRPTRSTTRPAARRRRAVIERKSSREIAKQAQAGAIVAETLDDAARRGAARRDDGRARPARRALHPRGAAASPTFKGYRGFPGSICASPNDMIVHGIPGPYELRDGDVLSIDVGVTYRGFVGDSAVTLAVGEVDGRRPPAARDLPGLAASRRSSRARSATGSATSATPCRRSSRRERLRRRPRSSSATASAGGCTRTRRSRTTAPPGRGPELREGMVFAIEPMITAGAA